MLHTSTRIRHHDPGPERLQSHPSQDRKVKPFPVQTAAARLPTMRVFLTLCKDKRAGAGCNKDGDNPSKEGLGQDPEVQAALSSWETVGMCGRGGQRGKGQGGVSGGTRQGAAVAAGQQLGWVWVWAWHAAHRAQAGHPSARISTKHWGTVRTRASRSPRGRRRSRRRR